jgi:ribosome-associated translation inhibitor RaiA
MKLTLEHHHLRSTDELDSMIEERILALQSRLQIDEANVRLARHYETSPAFSVHIHLVTPGPDVLAEGRDHTLRAAIEKVMTGLEGLGSTVERWLKGIPCSVLVVRPPAAAAEKTPTAKTGQ